MSQVLLDLETGLTGRKDSNPPKLTLYAVPVEHWESYVLGAFGILLTIGALVLQVAALAWGRTWWALLLTLGVVSGAVLYRAGFRLMSH